ncbi:hypothetical protein A2U01_0079290, partial [Trifolium medium]|nr:hypothetical protein [Trifolium medium]
MSARRNQKANPVNSTDSDDYDIFFNSDADHRFNSFIGAKSFHDERGFMFNMQEETQGVLGDIAKVINVLGWAKL